MSLAKAIKNIMANVLKNEEIYSLVCNVDKVNDDGTIDCTPIRDEDADIFGVRLQADIDKTAIGLLIKPVVNSNVVVTFIGKNTAYVALYGEIDEILIDDGKNGGLIKIEELRTQVNKNTAVLDTLKTILEGVPIPEPGSGAPSALQAALGAATTPLATADLKDIENPKIKH